MIETKEMKETSWTVMEPKIKVLLLAIHYPFAIKNYFETALRKRADIDLKTVGPFTSRYIPWMGGMILPNKYAIAPTLPVPFPPNVGKINYEFVSAQLPKDWKPDLVITIDAGINWVYKPTSGYVVTVGTDPHVLNYEHARSISDKFFNMQRVYMEKSDIYLPYAYSPEFHYPDDTVSKDTDAVLIGMPYETRVQWVNKLRERGVSVIFENGPIFDEARQLYNRGRIGLNWSSMMDLNARAFELAAMKMGCVMNNVPDMNEFGFLSHAQRFNTLGDAVEAVLIFKNNPEVCRNNAELIYQAVQGQTYDARVQQILQECGFV